MNLTINGRTVVVSLRPIKNTYLYVRPPDGHLEVRAPKGTSQGQIVSFVQSKEAWIRQHQKRVIQRATEKENPQGNGDTFFLWGREYTLAVGRGGRRAMTLDGDRAVLCLLPGDTQAEQEKFLREWYRTELKKRIDATLPELERQSGLSCSSYGTRWMKTRWGTCNTRTHKIWLNVQLAKKSPICLEYVLLHELAHTKVPNHGPAFQALMDQIMPEWRKVQKLLKYG